MFRRFLKEALRGLKMHSHVVTALMLRDIKTRIGGSYFGFLFGLLLPIGHVAVALGVYVLTGRRSPIGSDVTIFLSTAIVPFVVWSYTHQKMIQSIPQNAPLMTFPIVKPLDISTARALTECLSSSIVVLFVLSFFYVFNYDVLIFDSHSFLFAILLSYLLGVSTGYIFGILGMFNYVFSMIGYLIIPLFWITSGVFFIPDSLPTAYQNLLYLFTLSQIVDIVRMSMYPGYVSHYSSYYFIITNIVFNAVLAMSIQRIIKNKMVI